MSDALSFAELGRQQVELLPTRTVLSKVGFGGGGGNTFIGCQNGFQPTTVGGFLGLIAIPGFASNGCTSGGTIH